MTHEAFGFLLPQGCCLYDFLRFVSVVRLILSRVLLNFKRLLFLTLSRKHNVVDDCARRNLLNSQYSYVLIDDTQKVHTTWIQQQTARKYS